MNLALEMMKNQLVLSEYPPDTKPLRWHFPSRNRIISGLSKGTLIIEAKRKSGSLITANFAVNEGRDVFSLPGSIFNPYSIGANDLIQQGAKLVTEAEDILVEIR
jgi:DNA processing protein